MIDDDELPPDVIVTLAEFKEKQRHERNNGRKKEQKARGKAYGSCDQEPRSPFIMKPGGLYWRNPDGDGDDVFLSGPFQILAETAGGCCFNGRTATIA